MNRPKRAALVEAIADIVERASAEVAGMNLYHARLWFRDALTVAGLPNGDRFGNPIRVVRSYPGLPEQVLAEVALAMVVEAADGVQPARRPAWELVDRVQASRREFDFTDGVLSVVGSRTVGVTCANLVERLADSRSFGRTLPDHGQRYDKALPYHAIPLFGASAGRDYANHVMRRIKDICERQAEDAWHDVSLVVPDMGSEAAQALMDVVRAEFAGADCLLNMEPVPRLHVSWGEDEAICDRVALAA